MRWYHWLAWWIFGREISRVHYGVVPCPRIVRRTPSGQRYVWIIFEAKWIGEDGYQADVLAERMPPIWRRGGPRLSRKELDQIVGPSDG